MVFFGGSDQVSAAQMSHTKLPVLLVQHFW